MRLDDTRMAEVRDLLSRLAEVLSQGTASGEGSGYSITAALAKLHEPTD